MVKKREAMTKTDELLREFADQEYPLYGSRMDEHREEMRKALIVRLRKLIAQVEEERMPSQVEINKQAAEEGRTLNKYGESQYNTTTQVACIRMAEWFRNHMSGSSEKPNNLEQQRWRDI